MSLFSKDILKQRQSNLANAWNSLLNDEDCVVVYCGDPIQKPGGLDQTYFFLPHPCYFWLSGLRRPQGAMLYSKKTGWIEFVKPISREERVWEGDSPDLEGEDVSQLAAFIKARGLGRQFQLGLPGKKDLQASPDQNLQSKLKITFDQVRRLKDAAEVELIKECAAIAKKGYDRLKTFIQPGVTEKEIQIEFEAVTQRNGAHKFPYETLVGAGTNAAIIHATPSNRILGPEDLLLIDAGVDINDYCVDITRVFAASGKFQPRQQQIYDLVMLAQKNAIAKATDGVEWHAVHEISARTIADGLKSLNILKGSTDSILESGAIGVFYPHGVGHLVGLKVRDVGYEENTQPKKYCGASLRIDMKIKKDFILTVEPGCYFIAALINDEKIRSDYCEFINWSEVEKWKDLGGVRIEDDILITNGAPINLTDIVEK